jgi:hypothetical protein
MESKFKEIVLLSLKKVAIFIILHVSSPLHF